jgi:hypothetical protein
LTSCLDQDVDLAKRIVQDIEEVVHLGLVTDICLRDDRTLSSLPNHSGSLMCPPFVSVIVNNDISAMVGKQASDALSDATVRSSYERDTARQR